MSDPIARIEDALRRLGADHAPPAGWEERVLAATRKPDASPRARRPFYRQRWWLMVAPVLVAAGLILWLVQAQPPPAPDEPAVSWRIDQRTTTRGIGSDGAVGDVVRAQIAGGQGYRVLRVYRHDVLILDCRATPDGQVSQDVIEQADGEAASCTLDHDALVLRSVLRATGTYKLLGLASPGPLPASQHNFDLDQAAAIRARLFRQSLVKSFEVE